MTDLLDEVMNWVRAGSYQNADDGIVAVMSEDARLLAQAFTGEEGRKRLMFFARLTVLRPPVNHTLPGAEATAYAQLRQGQDTVFAALVRYLDHHQKTLETLTHDRSHHADPGPVFPFARSDDAPGDERFTDSHSEPGPGGWDAAGLIGGR